MNNNDRSVRFLLGAIAVLLGANLLVQMHPAVSTAQAAGIPDSGAQMQAIVDQLVDLNKKVDKLDMFVESGKMEVKVKDTKAEK